MAGSFATGWRQVTAGFLLLAATGMVASTYSLVAVKLDGEFQPSRTVLMLTMTVLSGASAVMAPLLGSLLDRLSLRLMMLLGACCLASGYFAISLATSFDQVLLIFGLLLAPANVLIGPVAVTVLLSRWFADKRGRAVGIAIAGISAGGVVFPQIVQGLFELLEWREALRYLALILLLWTVPATLLVVNRPSDRGLNPDGAETPPMLAQAELAREPLSVRAILSDPAFWLIAVTVSIVTAGMKGMITNMAPLALDAGIAPKLAALLVSIYAACGFLAKINFAALADRVGPRKLMFAALGGFAAGMICLTQAAGGFYVIAFGVAITGLFGGLMIPAESYLAPRIFGQRGVGRAMGLLSGAILVVMLLTPPIFGKIYDVTGAYTAIFWTFAGLAVAGLFWLPRLRLHAREVPLA
jgi:MFS family permease